MPARSICTAFLGLILAVAGCSEPPGPKSASNKGAGGGAPPKAAPAGSAQERTQTTLYALDVVDAKTAFAWGTSDEGYVGSVVLKTSDGGATWACVLRASMAELVGLDFVDANNGVAISDGGVVFSTTDGGVTWKGSNDLGLLTTRHAFDPTDTSSELNGVAFADAKNGWAFGGRDERDPKAKPGTIASVTRPLVLRTVDGGASWKEAKAGADVPAIALQRGQFVDAQNGWVVGGNVEDDAVGAVLRTTDGGATWKASTPSPKQVPEDLCFVDATHGWIVATGLDANDEPGPSEVYATTDGGATWRSVAKVPATLKAVRFADASTGWAAGGEGKIFVTTDGGATWTEQTTQDWGKGQTIEMTDPQYAPGGSAPTYSRFVLVAPGHGWASADLGVYEYRAK